MGDSPTIKKTFNLSKLKEIFPLSFGAKKKIEVITDIIDIPPAPEAEFVAPVALIDEEKVEVLIKESVMINPRDFSAFKHALEEFVADWDK